MGFWSRLLGNKKSDSITTSLDLFREIYGSRLSSSGVAINWKTALEVSTVLGCCRVVAEGVAQVPWRVYRENNLGKSVAFDHPLNRLLSRSPNSWQSSFEFRETLIFHAMLTNNAYVFVNRVGRDRQIREMIPIEPGRVAVRQNKDYSLDYIVHGHDGVEQSFAQDAIWHLRGPSWNSWTGIDAIGLARNAIGLSSSLESGQADFQKNGARTSGVLAVDEKLTPEKFTFLSGWVDKHLPGGERAGKPIIADMGIKYSSMMMTSVDQQLIETRKHQIEEICRFFRVMPIMIGHADKTATYASAEQMFLAHVVHTLTPWYERIEKSANMNLLSDADYEAGFYTKFNPNALMRGAAKDRADFYAKGLGSGGAKGWLTQNDVREYEELNRLDDPEADKLPQSASRNSSNQSGQGLN